MEPPPSYSSGTSSSSSGPSDEKSLAGLVSRESLNQLLPIITDTGSMLAEGVSHVTQRLAQNPRVKKRVKKIARVQLENRTGMTFKDVRALQQEVQKINPAPREGDASGATSSSAAPEKGAQETQQVVEAAKAYAPLAAAVGSFLPEGVMKEVCVLAKNPGTAEVIQELLEKDSNQPATDHAGKATSPDGEKIKGIIDMFSDFLDEEGSTSSEEASKGKSRAGDGPKSKGAGAPKNKKEPKKEIGPEAQELVDTFQKAAERAAHLKKHRAERRDLEKNSKKKQSSRSSSSSSSDQASDSKDRLTGKGRKRSGDRKAKRKSHASESSQRKGETQDSSLTKRLAVVALPLILMLGVTIAGYRLGKPYILSKLGR